MARTASARLAPALLLLVACSTSLRLAQACTLDLDFKAFIHEKAGVPLSGESGTWIRLTPPASGLISPATAAGSCIYTNSNGRGFGEAGSSKLDTSASFSCDKIGALTPEDFRGATDVTKFTSESLAFGIPCPLNFDDRRGEFLEHDVQVTNTEDQSVVRISAQSQLGLPAAGSLPFGLGDLAAPDIEYDLVLTLRRRGDSTSITLEGSHRGFPFYELIANGESVYQFEPAVSFPVDSLVAAAVELSQTRSLTRTTDRVACAGTCVEPAPPTVVTVPPVPPTPTCFVEGRGGTCRNRDLLPCAAGAFFPGHCPGPANIQCCAPLAETPAPSDSRCSAHGSFTGICKDSSSNRCFTGAYYPGFCPGSVDIQCCAVNACRNASGESGVCKNTDDPLACTSGSFESGLCPGPSNVKCCI